MKQTTNADYESNPVKPLLPDRVPNMHARKAKPGRPARRTGLEEGGKRSAILALVKTGQNLEMVLPPELNQLQNLSHLLKTMRREHISSTVLQAALSLHSMRNEPINLKDLAASLEIATPNITSVVDSLERIGFASRTACGKDRRQIHVTLTSYGESFVARVGELFAGCPTTATEPSRPHD